MRGWPSGEGKGWPWGEVRGWPWGEVKGWPSGEVKGWLWGEAVRGRLPRARSAQPGFALARCSCSPRQSGLDWLAGLTTQDKTRQDDDTLPARHTQPHQAGMTGKLGTSCLPGRADSRARGQGPTVRMVAQDTPLRVTTWGAMPEMALELVPSTTPRPTWLPPCARSDKPGALTTPLTSPPGAMALEACQLKDCSARPSCCAPPPGCRSRQRRRRRRRRVAKP